MKISDIPNYLSKEYNYKKLSPDLSEYYRDLYLKDLPKFLNINGGGPLFTVNGSLICQDYDRIVIGDYGAYVEFTTPGCQFVVEKGQEYRYQDRYKNCKYFWLTIPDKSHIKIYKQRHTVSYADYVVGKFYVSVYEVQPEMSFGDQNKYCKDCGLYEECLAKREVACEMLVHKIEDVLS